MSRDGERWLEVGWVFRLLSDDAWRMLLHGGRFNQWRFIRQMEDLKTLNLRVRFQLRTSSDANLLHGGPFNQWRSVRQMKDLKSLNLRVRFQLRTSSDAKLLHGGRFNQWRFIRQMEDHKHLLSNSMSRW